MTAYLLEMFGVSLGLTLLLEIPVGWCMGMRNRNCLYLLILVNILTNPAAVFLCWIGWKQLPVEIMVVAVEALVYLWFSRDEQWKIPHPVLLSVLANSISWSLGYAIQLTGG